MSPFRKPSRTEGVAAPLTSVTRRPIVFEAELLGYTGGRQALQNLADSLLDAGDQVTTYVHGLENLEKRFPALTASTMSAEDRALLNRMELDLAPARGEPRMTWTGYWNRYSRSWPSNVRALTMRASLRRP